MARISAIEAGRKGGKSRSAAKLAACRKNGFQKCYPDSAPVVDKKPEPAKPQSPLLVFKEQA